MGGLVALVLLVMTGCEGLLTNFAASSSIRIFSRAAPALSRFGDIELAEAAIPGSLGTLEGLMVVAPDSEALHLTLARAYSSFAFGFMVDHMEQAQLEDNEERAEHYRARASAAFVRARTVGLEQMSAWERDDGGAEGHMRRGLEAWRTYLGQFRAEHAGQMFWTAYSWAQYIGINRDDVNALADLPFVLALAERVMALDHTYYDYAPHGLRAGLIGSAPQQLGGRPDIARQEFETAIAATHRTNLVYLVMEARIVAVSLQDRGLYRRLLEEVISAGDVNPANRLGNQIAKRRARRYLGQIDDLFEPEGAGNSDTPAATPAPTAE